MKTFAETNVNFSDGQINIEPPPDSVFDKGFTPETATTRGMPAVAQWFNFMFRTIARHINRDVVSNATGTKLFPYQNSMIRLEAVDKTDINKYLVAVGFRGASGVHQLKVVSNNVLTLGTATANGDQPIVGGSTADIMTVGYSRQIGEI